MCSFTSIIAHRLMVVANKKLTLLKLRNNTDHHISQCPTIIDMNAPHLYFVSSRERP